MIQIIGTKKNRATQHALRFFKERRITFQWRDLTEKGLSRGELEYSQSPENVAAGSGKQSFSRRGAPGRKF